MIESTLGQVEVQEILGKTSDDRETKVTSGGGAGENGRADP